MREISIEDDPNLLAFDAQRESLKAAGHAWVAFQGGRLVASGKTREDLNADFRLHGDPDQDRLVCNVQEEIPVAEVPSVFEVSEL